MVLFDVSFVIISLVLAVSLDTQGMVSGYRASVSPG